MKVHTNLEDLSSIQRPIVTIGTFDGVHAGHRAIIKRVIDLAGEQSGESALVTFEPHPRFLINPNHRLKLLTTLSEKKELLQSLGLDHLIITPFTEGFAAQAAKDYVEDFIIKKIKPAVLVIGYDHHFGKGRSGDFDLLQQYSNQGNFQLEEISKQLVDDAHVSSTAIRNALDEGDVAEAGRLLKSNYQMNGVVVQGDQKGRTIGFPTANLDLKNDKKLIPANGVYAVKANVNNSVYNAVVNIGYRPTVNDEKELRLEVHIFDFDQEIYNSVLQVEFIERLRAEKKFESFEALKKQIKLDCKKAKMILTKTT